MRLCIQDAEMNVAVVTEEGTHLCTSLVKSLYQIFMFESGDLRQCERKGKGE